MSSSNTKYLSRMDPLQLLRNSFTSNKKPKQKQKYLYFDKDLKIPLKTPTSWLSPITNKQYNIGSIWCYLQYKQKSTQYILKVTQLDLERVNIADQSQIESYFTGKIQQTKFINQDLRIELLAKHAKRDQPQGGFTQGQIELKKKQNNLPWDLRVIDYVLKYQRPTGSKTRSLKCPNQTFNFFLDLLRQKQQPAIILGKSRLNRIYQKKKLPIIIVPEAIQAGNISISNIQKFLIHGKYEQPKPLSNSLQRKIQIQGIIKNKKVCFQVTNNPSLLSLSDWQNVVGVFILGQKSQFSKWAIRDPFQLFKKTKGFLLKYPDITARYDANDWNIKTFIMDRNARYRDEQMKKKIWLQIEQFLFQKL